MAALTPRATAVCSHAARDAGERRVLPRRQVVDLDRPDALTRAPKQPVDRPDRVAGVLGGLGVAQTDGEQQQGASPSYRQAGPAASSSSALTAH